MKLHRPLVPILTAIASLGALPCAHATFEDSTPFLLDTRNYEDSTPLFSVDTRAPDLIANTGITDSGGNSFTLTMAMLKVTGGGTITFTLVTGPVHGTLFLDGIAQGAGATFTQAQIDAGLLSYQRAAGDPLTDTFEVAAMDADAGLLGGNLSFAVAGIPGASGSLFLLDTRNYTDSGDSTVHTDNRAYDLADTVPGSLRQAIANASAGETVDFDAALSGGTITLDGGQMVLAKDLTIDASALSGGVAVSGNDVSRIFEISSGNTVGIKGGMTFRNGSAIGLFGGAIKNSGSLSVDGSTFIDNTAGFGGAINSSGTELQLSNCTFTGNTGTTDGGAVRNTTGTMTLAHSTLSGNTAGGAQGGGILAFSDYTLRNSIVSGNSSPDILNFAVSNVVYTLEGSNLVGAIANGTADGTGTTSSAAPLLAPPGDYGGPTQTMALRGGSPAINTAGATALPTDQRGFARSVGGAPDIGAYESGNAAGYGVWATEMIAEGLDASFTGNADEDPTANGAEYALGTGVLISDPASPNNPEVITNGAGEIEITFGFNPIAAVDTRWIIERSTDLENYTEIYRYDGPMSTGAPQAGISAVVGATSITVTDPNPPFQNVFYRFGAQTAP